MKERRESMCLLSKWKVPGLYCLISDVEGDVRETWQDENFTGAQKHAIGKENAEQGSGDIGKRPELGRQMGSYFAL